MAGPKRARASHVTPRTVRTVRTRPVGRFNRLPLAFLPHCRCAYGTPIRASAASDSIRSPDPYTSIRTHHCKAFLTFPEKLFRPFKERTCARETSVLPRIFDTPARHGESRFVRARREGGRNAACDPSPPLGSWRAAALRRAGQSRPTAGDASSPWGSSRCMSGSVSARRAVGTCSGTACRRSLRATRIRGTE